MWVHAYFIYRHIHVYTSYLVKMKIRFNKTITYTSCRCFFFLSAWWMWKRVLNWCNSQKFKVRWSSRQLKPLARLATNGQSAVQRSRLKLSHTSSVELGVEVSFLLDWHWHCFILYFFNFFFSDSAEVPC